MHKDTSSKDWETLSHNAELKFLSTKNIEDLYTAYKYRLMQNQAALLDIYSNYNDDAPVKYKELLSREQRLTAISEVFAWMKEKMPQIFSRRWGANDRREWLAPMLGEKVGQSFGFEAARSNEGKFVIMEGDSGGQIYLTAPMSLVKCDESVLINLFYDIDSLQWHNIDDANINIEARNPGDAVFGGMGGGIITTEVWIHPSIEDLGIRESIISVLSGKSRMILSKSPDDYIEPIKSGNTSAMNEFFSWAQEARLNTSIFYLPWKSKTLQEEARRILRKSSEMGNKKATLWLEHFLRHGFFEFKQDVKTADELLRFLNPDNPSSPSE